MRLPLVLTTCALVLWGCSGDPEPRSPQAAAPPSGDGLLVIAYTPESADTLPAVGKDSLTVLAWLQQACDSAGIPLGVKHYSFGDLVTEIGSRKSGGEGDWLYKVNGGMVPESAGSHRVSPDDTVLFFFQ